MRLFKRKTKFLDWNEYKNKIDFLDIFKWQQSVRKQNVRLI